MSPYLFVIAMEILSFDGRSSQWVVAVVVLFELLCFLGVLLGVAACLWFFFELLISVFTG